MAQQSKFESSLRLWMASLQATEEQCDQVCADRRIAMDIKTKDYGGIIQDISGPLYRVGATEAARKFQEPQEQLMLMMLLRQK